MGFRAFTGSAAEACSAEEGCTAVDGAAGCEAATLSAGVCVPPQAAMERHNAAVSDAVDAFQTEFAKIGEISGQFNDVIQGVTTVSDGAIEDIRELKELSLIHI